MLDRYCLCGKKIHVQFLKRNERWSPTFWNLALFSGQNQFECPACGRRIHIDELK